MPTTTQHIPPSMFTASELEELGFVKEEGSLYHILKLPGNMSIQAVEFVNVYFIDSTGYGPSLNLRDKAHLQSIILAFQPQ